MPPVRNAPNPLAPVQLQPMFLPGEALYGQGAALGWEVSPQPYCLTTAQMRQIRQLGPALQHWMTACDHLYRQSSAGQVFPWVADWIHRGKPEALIRFARMNRFKHRLPAVIRPDLLVTDDGFALCEIDAVPGGIGFSAALANAYSQSGFSTTLGGGGHLVDQFLALLLGQYQGPAAEPVIAIVVSDEAADYRPELTWLRNAMAERYPAVFVVSPRDLDLVRDRLVFCDADGEDHAIDLIYRFFELFDLPNIPKMELIQYAIKRGLVDCTPPFAFHIEEKLWLALLHHPVLRSYWRDQLGEADFHALLAVVPPGWVLDPAPLPPQAVIPGLSPAGVPVQDFAALGQLTQKQREWVIKPSGFSPLAWGSRGVVIGHDESQSVWSERLEQALKAFDTTPHILQAYRKPVVQSLQRLDLTTGQIHPFQGRTRLCPYYFVSDGVAELAGILATSCPADKKIIHGMKDAILAPCMPSQTDGSTPSPG